MRFNILFLVLVLSGCAGWRAAPDPAPPAAATATPARNPELLMQAIAAAGVPYHRGGASYASGFDCSGLVVYVFRRAYGIRLPHNAKAQSEFGRSVPRDRLAPGDLVFYNTEHRRFSHVGIYLGDGRFIHAPRPGAAVRVENMRLRYWIRRYDGARRIPPPPPASGASGAAIDGSNEN